MHPEDTVTTASLAGRTTEWHPLWMAFAQAYEELVDAPHAADEEAFRDELVFCLLGGHGVTYELTSSVLPVVRRLDIFAARWTPGRLERVIARELARPQFEPRRSDGSLRRYRFPNRKARLLVAAREWLLQECPVTLQLRDLDDERGRRELLCRCPGIGPKSASWLLRNTGYASELAILDVHVIRAMREYGYAEDGITLPRDYDRLEGSFLAWCGTLDARPDAFDLFLWEWQRGTIRPHARRAS
jgi:hypothetical protein